MLPRQTSARRPANLRGFKSGFINSTVIISSAAGHIINHLAQGGPHGHFHQACIGNMPRYGKGFRTRAAQGADFAEGFCPHFKHFGYGSQGFHIINNGRFAKKPALAGERRLNFRHTALALHRRNQGCFLSANEGSGSFHYMNFKILTGTENIFAQQTQGFGLFNSGAHALNSQRIFHTHINISLVRANRPCGYHHPFQNRVRVSFHYTSVHKRARVALVRVANDVFFRSRFHAG